LVDNEGDLNVIWTQLDLKANIKNIIYSVSDDGYKTMNEEEDTI